jgi:hypothetical protein
MHQSKYFNAEINGIYLQAATVCNSVCKIFNSWAEWFERLKSETITTFNYSELVVVYGVHLQRFQLNWQMASAREDPFLSLLYNIFS